MQLYNALNGTDYEDASQLEIVTIESAVYVVMKNDLAFVNVLREFTAGSANKKEAFSEAEAEQKLSRYWK